MDASEQIQKIGEFIENKRAEIAERIRKGELFLEVDFSELSKHDPELAEELLENPEDILKAGEIAVTQTDVGAKKFWLRFKNLPESSKMKIRDIRSVHINKFFSVDGIVRQKSDVRPQVTIAKFECPSCGNVLTMPQLESKFNEPTNCACGRKGKFKQLSKELVDAQGLVLEENPEKLEGGEQPKRINIFLKEDLVSPLSEKKTNPGMAITVTGQLKEIPIISKTGAPTTRFDLMIEANHVEPKEESFFDLKISKSEEKEITELSEDPHLLKKMVDSIAPSIYGHDLVKEALLLQLFGGVNKKRNDGVITRGDMHILLIGDPGCGKCVSGETKVVLSSGKIIKIKEAKEDEKVHSINLKGKNQAFKITKTCRRTAPARLLQITTSSGNKITLTKEHPLFTTKNGLIFAKKAEDFKQDEFIATPSKIEITGSLQKIPRTEKNRARNRLKNKLPDFLNEELARLIGYLAGDSHARIRKSIIGFTNNDGELLEDFRKVVRNNLGITATTRTIKGSKETYFSSLEIAKILQKITPALLKKSGEKKAGDAICESPNSIVKEFLKAYYDCEAHIDKNTQRIEVSSKSKELIEETRVLLLRFGIISQISEPLKSSAKNKIKRKHYMLSISGEDAIKYKESIGFTSTKKQKELEENINCNANTNIKTTPGLKEILTVIRKKYGFSTDEMGVPEETYKHYEKGDRNPSKTSLKKIVERYKTVENDILVSVLRQTAESEIFWDRIKEIKEIESEEEYVYDIEINEVHNFVANGVIAHNSQLLKRVNIVAPKARYVSGKGASGAGLTAAVVKDEFIQGWSLEAGALVLASDGMCCIDEMDKMSPEDRSAMHEALEQQTVSISKANIQATLSCKTTVLAAANPKLGRFDPYTSIVSQIDLPPPLISRFDLIFPLRDLPNAETDTRLATHILILHQNPHIENPPISTELLRKYIAYAKRIKPVLNEGAMDEIRRYYVEIRNRATTGEAGAKSVPITARHLEALVRLSEAISRMKLSNKVTRKEAKSAIELLHSCLSQVGVDPETGRIDTDILTTGISTSQRGKIIQVKEIIAALEGKLGKDIPVEEVVKSAEAHEIDKATCEAVIEKLRRSGDIFEPRPGVIRNL